MNIRVLSVRVFQGENTKMKFETNCGGKIKYKNKRKFVFNSKFIIKKRRKKNHAS